MKEIVMNLFKVSESGALIIVASAVVVLICVIFLIIYSLIKKNKNANKEIENNVVIVEEKTIEPKDEKIEEKPQVVEKPIEKPIIKETKKVKEVKKKEEPKTKKQLSGRYEIFPVSKYFMYRLKASNGEILAISEIYKTNKGVNDAISTVKNNIEVGTLTVNEDKHGLWQFRLYSVNKRLLVASACYETKDRCESAMESFKKFAFISPVYNLAEDTEGYIEEVKAENTGDKKGGKIVIQDYNPKAENEFKLIASNGEILFTSIPYKTSDAILSTLETLKETIEQGTFFVTKDKNGSYQFKLYSKLGRNVLYGEAYKTKQAVISALNSAVSFVNLAEKELPENLK